MRARLLPAGRVGAANPRTGRYTIIVSVCGMPRDIHTEQYAPLHCRRWRQRRSIHWTMPWLVEWKACLTSARTFKEVSGQFEGQVFRVQLRALFYQTISPIAVFYLLPRRFQLFVSQTSSQSVNQPAEEQILNHNGYKSHNTHQTSQNGSRSHAVRCIKRRNSVKARFGSGLARRRSRWLWQSPP